MSKTINKRQQKEDLEYLIERLNHFHPNPWFKYSEEVFRDDCAEIVSISDELSIKEFGIEVMKLVIRLGDAHSYVKNLDFLGYDDYPVRFRFFDNGVYLTEAPKEDIEYLGKELSHVNDVALAELKEMLLQVVPTENLHAENQKYTEFLNDFSILKYFGIADGNVKYTFTDESSFEVSNSKENDLASIAPKDLPFTLNKDKQMFIKDLGNKVLYFQYNDCEFWDEMKVEDVVEELKKSDYKKLIIDFRDNPGGNEELMYPLLDYLRENPSKYEVFILTNRRVFSSALNNTVDFSELECATCIGEIPHGCPTHFGSMELFDLPNSGLTIRTSIIDIVFPNYDYGEVFVPDVVINTTIEDYKNGWDPQWEYLENKYLKN